MLLMIDNYDSFTYNLVQYFGELNVTTQVARNDQITLDEIETLAPQKIVISPGPGRPEDAGISLAVVERFAGRIPILGVCLGHQCIAQQLGGRIIRAHRIMHGKTSWVLHDQSVLFRDIPNPLKVTRYHSLVVEPNSLPDCLQMTAWTQVDDQMEAIMAVQHRELALYGVQFHPESIMSEHGHQLLMNFIE
ncbi:MAG: anthranilate/aminodeoxychorismate synthase component II [Legionellales bacterium]|nr:anthranilate/aminodeoxychorismate synthase component II [Legionellales bacterium]